MGCVISPQHEIDASPHPGGPAVMRLLRITGGFVLLAAGLIMIVTPGPGLLAIGSGLAMLASEFAWAKRLLERSRRLVMRVRMRG
jgi:uncharacterized protein (TIGR02611 family)